MITLKQSGDFNKVTGFLERAKETVRLGELDRLGRQGVAALSAATPVDTGETANSWYYKIEHGKGTATVSFYNSNIEGGCQVAAILQYGHGTKNGMWIEGIDYINPAIEPIFSSFVEETWNGVIRY